MFDMRSVLRRAKTLSTNLTNQVSYEIFIDFFLSTGNEPAYGDKVVRY